MKSGMLAAEAIYPLLIANGEAGTVLANGGSELPDEKPIEAVDYESALYNSWVGKELKEVRNAHTSFYSPLGTLGGMAYTAFSCFISKGNEPWTFHNQTKDCEKTKPAAECKEIEYPKPDGKLSFDLLTNLQKSGTAHDHDQPAHLRVKPDLAHVPSGKSAYISIQFFMSYVNIICNCL